MVLAFPGRPRSGLSHIAPYYTPHHTPHSCYACEETVPRRIWGIPWWLSSREGDKTRYHRPKGHLETILGLFTGPGGLTQSYNLMQTHTSDYPYGKNSKWQHWLNANFLSCSWDCQVNDICPWLVIIDTSTQILKLWEERDLSYCYIWSNCQIY